MDSLFGRDDPVPEASETQRDVCRKKIAPKTDYSNESVRAEAATRFFEAYKRLNSLEAAQQETGVRATMMYDWIRKFEYIRKIAASFSFGNAANMIAEDEMNTAHYRASVLFDVKSVWNENDKFEAIKAICSNLEMGIPFTYACKGCGVSEHEIEQWIEQAPILLKIFDKSETKWVRYFFSCFAKAAKESAERGRLGDIVEALERRFPDVWGKVDTIDINTRQELVSKKKDTVIDASIVSLFGDII